MLDPTPKDSATPTNTPESTPLILVCYHKFSTPIIASEILRPIIVGAANMGEEAKILQEKLESKLPKNLRLEGGRVSRVESSFLSLRGDTIANLNDSAQDSRISKETSANAERYPLFCDEKCGLQGKSQGSYLSGDLCDFSQLPHLSRKTSEAVQGAAAAGFFRKSTKSTTSNTANPRILEEESQAEWETSCREQQTLESTFSKVDSSNTAPTLSNSQAAGFCDDFVGCQAIGKGATLAVVTADDRADSRKSAQKPTPFILRDDSGDNISHLNPNFCELTAMYWAWKNVDSSYYGLFHYRRILDLSEQALKAPPSLEPTQVNAKKKWRASAFGYTKERVDELLAHYDIILPQRYIDRKDNLDFSDMTLYDIYAKYHYAKDLDKAIELIKSRHPEMQAALESTLFTKPPRWYIANMFIMRKELYFAYCEWLFPLLFALEAEIDISSYDSYQARIYGFLAERIFNIWLEYQRQTTRPRILEAPMILFMHKKPLIGWDINEKYKRFYFFGLRLYKAPIKPALDNKEQM